MIRKQTWLVLILFGVLIGYAFYLNDQKKTSAAPATPGPEAGFVIDPSEGVPTSIEVTAADGDGVRLVRAATGWALDLPEEAEANQASAEAAATQATSLRIIDEVTGDASIFGVDRPSFIITVDLGTDKKHTLEVGDSTPTNSGYYVRVDGDRIVIVGLSAIDSLTGLLSAPPYLNTPTPTQLPPTETPPAPAAEATVSPTP